MADITKEQVVEFIANMTVLELAEFIKELEEKFGVSAAAPAVAVAAATDTYNCIYIKRFLLQGMNFNVANKNLYIFYAIY